MKLTIFILVAFACTVICASNCNDNYSLNQEVKSFFREVYPRLKSKQSSSTLSNKLTKSISSSFEELFPENKRVHKVLAMTLGHLDQHQIHHISKVLKSKNTEQIKAIFTPLLKLYKERPQPLSIKQPNKINLNNLKPGDIIALSTRKGATAFLSNTLSRSAYDHIAVIGGSEDSPFVYNFNLRYKSHKVKLNDFIVSNSSNGFVYTTFRAAKLNPEGLSEAWAKIISGEKIIESCAQSVSYILEKAGVKLGTTDFTRNRNFDTEVFGRFLKNISDEIIQISHEQYFPQSLLDTSELVRVQGLMLDRLSKKDNISLWLHSGDTRRIARKFFLKYLEISPVPKNFDKSFKGYLISQYRVLLFKEYLLNNLL